MMTPDRLELTSWPWPEVSAGDDLIALVCGCTELRDGDIVVVTSKVISKAEGRASSVDRADLVARETERVVARKGNTVIAQTRHGLVLAAAGVDASNVERGRALALPIDPDESARRLRAGIVSSRGLNVAVVITDTAGRAWRVGQVDIAIGCAGMAPINDLAGTTDTYGNPLAVTASVVADEVAAAADLVKGKTSRRPLAVVRGMADLVLPAGEHGPGARAIIREPAADMFGLGARDAVIAAIHRRQGADQAVPVTTVDDPFPFDQIRSAHPDARLTITPGPGPARGWLCQLDIREGGGAEAWIESGRIAERIDALAWAHRLRAVAVETATTEDRGWSAISRTHWFVA